MTLTKGQHEMKKFLIVMVMLTTPQVSMAEDSRFDVCKSYGAYASSVMNARQTGMPATALYERAANPELGDDLSKMMNTVIGLAYSRPLFHTLRHQQRIISEFESDIVVSCMGGK